MGYFIKEFAKGFLFICGHQDIWTLPGKQGEVYVSNFS